MKYLPCQGAQKNGYCIPRQACPVGDTGKQHLEATDDDEQDSHEPRAIGLRDLDDSACNRSSKCTHSAYYQRDVSAFESLRRPFKKEIRLTSVGVNAQIESVTASVNYAFANYVHHKPSMLQDVEAGRRTEIDFINGAVAEKGKAAGVDTPVVRTLANLVKLIESGY